MSKKTEKQNITDIIPTNAQTKIETLEDIRNNAANLIFQIQDQSFKTAQTIVAARNFVKKIELFLRKITQKIRKEK